ncbi:zinc carboxypeptidase, partial [Ostertagia ostertagi]
MGKQSHRSLFYQSAVSGYGKDETITHYVNSLNFYVLPCLNPDGYEYTKVITESKSVCGVRIALQKDAIVHYGVERSAVKAWTLNRNFKFHWAESGSSYEPCSNIYHGDHVFSEPESRAVRDYLNSDELRGKVDGFITLHSYAQLWIYPYSHAQQNYPEDISELRRTARRAINRLHRQYGTEYRMGTGADTLLSNGFILHKKELIPTAVETFEGVKEVIEAVLEHNKIIKDPLSRIAPQLRKKQLFLPTTALTTTEATTTTTLADYRTELAETAIPTRARPWLTYRPRRTSMSTKWRSVHFNKYTTSVSER